MKKIFAAILSLILIFFLCACGTNTRESLDIPSSNSSEQADLPDEGLSDENDGANFTPDVKNGARGYVAFSDARYEFENHAIDISLNEESVIYGKTLVLTPDLEVFDYLTPLHFFGETLDDEEIVVKEMVLDMLTEHSKSFRSADLQRESDNSYTMTIDTEEEEQIFIQIEYHPNIDALRLVAENNGEHGLLFEYVNTGDGYAAQYYFNSVVGVGGTYGVQEKTMAMCVYKTIFSGKEGSCARFDDVEEPASLLNGVPDEQAFIEGATHWFTLKDDKLTGELDGITF